MGQCQQGEQSKQAEALTNWRMEDRQCQQGETEQASGGTHTLESGGQAMSAGRNRVSKQRYSQTGEWKMGNVSRGK